MEGPNFVEHAAQAYQMDSWSAQADAMGMDGTILVVDPATRKLSIPVAAVAHTQALLRSDRVPSICMLYLQGRCRQGMNCHQLHADPTVVQMLRNDVVMRASCCPEHGEEVTLPTLLELNPEMTSVVLEGQPIAASRVATTNGMQRMVADRAAAIAEAKDASVKADATPLQKAQICRLHLQGRCRYAEDCNFIHLCRGLCEGDASPELMKVLAGIANSTPSRAGRPAGTFGFNRSFAGTPSSAFVPQMPPSPLYAGMPQSPNGPVEGLVNLEQGDSHGTSPPKSPNQSVTTPITGPWRRDPYSWDVVSPVRATPVKAAAAEFSA